MKAESRSTRRLYQEIEFVPSQQVTEEIKACTISLVDSVNNRNTAHVVFTRDFDFIPLDKSSRLQGVLFKQPNDVVQVLQQLDFKVLEWADIHYISSDSDPAVLMALSLPEIVSLSWASIRLCEAHLFLYTCDNKLAESVEHDWPISHGNWHLRITNGFPEDFQYMF